MNEFSKLPELLDRQKHHAKPYLEFLRVPSMSAGIYVLPAGASDMQQPHKQDEMYYIISGRARFVLGSDDQAVSEGSMIFVPAEVPHHFHTIEQEMTALVFFAPAES